MMEVKVPIEASLLTYAFTHFSTVAHHWTQAEEVLQTEDLAEAHRLS